MVDWSNWSGSFRGPVNRLVRPETLSQLQTQVRAVTYAEGRVHAEGSRWAFSAPAYCEDTVIDMSLLSRFPSQRSDDISALQRSLYEPLDGSGARLQVAVEAGIKIRDLYQGLSFDRDRGDPAHRPDLAASGIPIAGRIWTLPVLGGAGGQSIAGAISTGTHGGDVRRPPLSDAVLAMLVVGVGGGLHLLQPTKYVDVDLLRDLLAQPVEEHTDESLFWSAVVSVGRFGVVYAYVLQLEDETDVAIVETRTKASWRELSPSLMSLVRDAAAQDGFFQVVFSPYRRGDGDHTAYVTTHQIERPGNPTDETQPPLLRHVAAARGEREWAAIRTVLGGPLGVAALRAFPLLLEQVLVPNPAVIATVAALIGPPLSRVDTVLDNGEQYLAGDALGEIITGLQLAGLGHLIEILNGTMLEIEQRDVIDPSTPWKVKGTRFEIADFYNYDSRTYTGDSIELFFAADDALPDKINEILATFDELRAMSRPAGAYISVRFSGATRAVLGLTRFPVTASVEISFLRGMSGNVWALDRLKDVALRAGGFVHWGQQNDLTSAEVETSFGPRLAEWKANIERIDPHRLFSTPFTRQRDLEPSWTPDWTEWADLGLSGEGPPTAVSAESASGVDVFASDTGGILHWQRRFGASSGGVWRVVRPETTQLRPTVVRGRSGRLELFVIAQGNLAHIYQLTPDGVEWSGWNVKGFPLPGQFDPDRLPTIAAASHADGRLEVFGRAATVPQGNQLAHCWAHAADGAWTTVHYRDGAIVSSPVAGLRSLAHGGDHLVVAAIGPEGAVVSRHQTDPADDSSWTPWLNVEPPGERIRAVAPRGIAAITAGGVVRLFVSGPRDHLFMTVTAPDGSATPSWEPWVEFHGEGTEPYGQPAVAIRPAGGVVVVSRSLAGEVLGWLVDVPGLPLVHGPLRLGGRTECDPAVAVHADGTAEVFARAPRGGLWSRPMPLT